MLLMVCALATAACVKALHEYLGLATAGAWGCQPRRPQPPDPAAQARASWACRRATRRSSTRCASRSPDAAGAVAQAAAAGYNLRPLDDKTVTVALDETTELYDVDALLRALNGGKDAGFSAASLAEEVRRLVSLVLVRQCVCAAWAKCAR